MASSDVFMSSPPRSRTRDLAFFDSSSPGIPTLEEIFFNKNARNPPIGTGSHAPTTFTSAADVLRDAPEIDIETEKITTSPCRKSRPGKSRKRKSSTPDNLSNEQVSNSASVTLESVSPSDKPWQKFKTKAPEDTDGGSTSPPRLKTSNLKKSSGKATGTVSRHFSTEATQQPTGEEPERSEKTAADSSGEAALSTNLLPAMPRRKDWTPPRNSATIILDSDSDARELFSSAGKTNCSKGIFQTLHDQYGRQDTGPAKEVCPQFETEVIRKRQRLELVSTGQSNAKEAGREQSPATIDLNVPLKKNQQTRPKATAQKKKPRTVTDAAIAPFAVPAIPDLELAGPSTKESMLNYFDTDGAVKALVEHQTAVMSQRKTTGKETKPPAKAKRKTKAGSEKNPILLSPTSALKQSSNQDFLFGTSSQLVHEESPTMLRDIQAAIRASNNLSSDPFDDDDSPRRLWHAGARDEDGELMEMEIVDLQQGPAISDQTPLSAGRSFVDIDDLLDSPLVGSRTSPGPPESRQDKPHDPEPQSGKLTVSTETSQATGGAVEKPSTQPCPNYDLFTDAQLSQQITSYGFKPMKKRNAMIALLKQCWASKQQGLPQDSIQSMSKSARSPRPAARQPIEGTADNGKDLGKDLGKDQPRGRGRPKKTTAAKAAAPQPATVTESSPKRPRGRPSKDKNVATVVVPPAKSAPAVPSPKRPRGRPQMSDTRPVEIADSTEGSLSPASSPEPVFSSPSPVDLSITDDADMSLAMSPTDQEAELFRYITKAVTSAPRSQDPENPSWYEKMLLYDPIILEDLAAWLNGGPLTGQGYDGEVSPLEVKKWCERKSVICLWRQNINGKERKRY
ncbi:hypothetical protein F5Y17DRAFT_295810 [Xylariaceae sp. FL0594]|nr:hypothetical protein F5Y17DRAFT_295810 [Xylariaceae sp. FL0594]